MEALAEKHDKPKNGPIEPLPATLDSQDPSYVRRVRSLLVMLTEPRTGLGTTCPLADEARSSTVNTLVELEYLIDRLDPSE